MHIKQIIGTVLSSTVIFEPTLATTQSAAAAAATQTLSSIDYRFFIAGGVCAATSHGITTPIDVIKTKMQAKPDIYNQGMLNATTSIVKSEGAGVLLDGLGPTVLGYGIEGALKFGVYEVMKPVMSELLSSFSKSSDNTIPFLLAAIMAGAVASVVLCPMESIRIKLVTDESYQGCNFLTGFMKLMKEEGVISTFSGIWAMLSKQVPYTMGKQVSFDLVAGLLYAILLNMSSTTTVDDVKLMVSVSAAFVASLVACVFSQPGDMILTETYRNAKENDVGFFGVVRGIYENRGGLTGYFTGLQARIVHVSMIITSQLVIYDVVKQLLGLPATGSH